MKNKSGQAVMEFLMTYGWAILVVLMAVGILTYLGLFDQDHLRAEQKINQDFCENFCKNKGFECDEFNLMDEEIICFTDMSQSDQNWTTKRLFYYNIGFVE